MVYRTRLKYTEEIKSYIWDRYQQGDAIKVIACQRRSKNTPVAGVKVHHRGGPKIGPLGIKQYLV